MYGIILYINKTFNLTEIHIHLHFTKVIHCSEVSFMTNGESNGHMHKLDVQCKLEI